jgi:uncharacterized cupredoxin-like copper-binding protein
MRRGSTFLHLTFAVSAVVFAVQPGIAAQQEKVIAFEATDYGFAGPDRLSAGPTAIQIHNVGAELHHLQLVKLGKDKTAEDFMAALRSHPFAFPAWVRFMGGPNAVIPGDKAVAMQNLEPGQYLLLCLIPNETGVPHVALGMQKLLTVVPGQPRAQQQRPKAEVTITEQDFAFELSRDLRSGLRIIDVVNKGTIPHEVVLVKLMPGKSIRDFAQFGEHPVGEPPGQPVGGVVGLDTGQTASFTANLEAGSYGLICFFPEPESGTPHFAKGMMLEFAVKP